MPFPGGSWVVWRCVLLRAAGFPAREVLSLASAESAAAAELLLQAEDQAETLRCRALSAVDAALDDLRGRNEWADDSQRRPLLKALRSLSQDKLPRRVGEPGIDTLLAALEGAREEVSAARKTLARRFDDALVAASRELGRIARQNDFREAVCWQNRAAVDTGLDHLSGAPEKSCRNSRQRQHEEMAAKYLQRYCVKNDTIGFFGPVGWARLVIDEVAVRARPGARLCEAPSVYFESWCTDALAAKLASEPEMRPWLAPRLRAGYRIDGQSLFQPFANRLELAATHLRILAACDGTRPARSIAVASLVDPEVDVAEEGQVYALLEEFCRRRWLLWDLDGPQELYPEKTLRKKLEAIPQADLRTRALADLEELVTARDRVAQAAGDAAALAAAMRELEQTFERLTGCSATRHPGRTYAARSLVYPDCRRDVDVEIGQDFLRRLGPPLTLVLRGARWLAAQIARAAEARLSGVFEELSRRSGSLSVESTTFVAQAFSTLFEESRTGSFVPVVTAIERDFHRRWARIFSLSDLGAARRLDFGVAELEPRVEEEFGEPGPAWNLSRYLSPDILVAADDAEAFQRGDYEIVLGEIHCGNTMAWSCFFSQHPAPEELLRYVELDMEACLATDSQPWLLPQTPKQIWPQRMTIGLVLPRFYQYQINDDPPDPRAGEVLQSSMVVIERSQDGLRARTRDARVSFSALELFGAQLTETCNKVLGSLLPPEPYLPRIVVDGIVISRERWSFAAADLGFAAKDSLERFLAAKRFVRRYGIPRWCFYKVPGEKKPCFVDFDSPTYVDILARMINVSETVVAGAGRVGISEMLPTIDQCWLTDAAGNRFTSELRMVAYDRGDGEGAFAL